MLGTIVRFPAFTPSGVQANAVLVQSRRHDDPRRGLPRAPRRAAETLLVLASLALSPGACLSGASPQPSSTKTTTSNPVKIADAGGEAPRPAEEAAAPPTTAAAPLKQLPRGGRALFPIHRLVGFCGTPGAPALGELQGNLTVKAKALDAQAAHYAQGRVILPVFELIAVVVQSGPGQDGMYRRRVDSSVVDEYLRVARQSRALLLLNIQPGHSDFLTEVKYFESYLREPDVGVALDPEWAMKGKERPGVFYGQTTGGVLNDVAEYLSGIIEQGDLPEKALVFHEVNRGIIKDEGVLRSFRGVAIIKSVDGLGPVHAKIATYGNLMETMTAGVHPGFKLFFDEDTRNGSRLMTAKEVLALSPQPEYVMYE
ncbi:MAG: hypothetical protein M3O36_16770 [Myxococcota bacterium]|nr:hypothetical protein [Myxococcota bacterium]